MTDNTKIPAGLTSARPLTAMELNSIRLDSRHTLLTPEHLERLAQGKPLQPETPAQNNTKK